MQKFSVSRIISFKDFYLACSHMQKKKRQITTTPLPISQGIKTKVKKVSETSNPETRSSSRETL